MNRWFRLYDEAVDDEKLRLLAFEDRWHFIAILCCKSKGILDEPDTALVRRKIAVKLGLDLRALDEVVRRLAEVGLIDEQTLQPIAWDQRQYVSDGDPTNAERQKRFRNNKKQSRNAPVTDVSPVTLPGVTGTNGTATAAAPAKDDFLGSNGPVTGGDTVTSHKVTGGDTVTSHKVTDEKRTSNAPQIQIQIQNTEEPPFFIFPPSAEPDPQPQPDPQQAEKNKKKGATVSDLGKTRMTDDWEPKPSTLAAMPAIGIDAEFARRQIPHFRLYHMEAGTLANGFETLFVGWCKRAPKPPAKPDPLARRPGETLAEASDRRSQEYWGSVPPDERIDLDGSTIPVRKCYDQYLAH